MSGLDIDAMAALVGEAQLSPESAYRVLDETRACAEDLEDQRLRPLWAVLEHRVRARIGIDAVSVREALRKEPDDVRKFAIAVVTKPALGAARERLTLLRDGGVRRRFLAELRNLASATNDGTSLAELSRRIARASSTVDGANSRVRNCAGDSLSILEHLESVWTGRATPALQTGFTGLDGAIGGLVNNLIVVGARTGVGKSALVAGLVRNWVTAGVRVGVLAYEDDARDMGARIASCEGGVSVRETKGLYVPQGPSREARLAAIAEGLEWWHKHEALVETDDARPSGNASDVIASIREMHARGCRVILLDNMTCVRLDGPDDRRHDLLIEATLRDIRGEAQRLEVPIFVVGHLKRGQADLDESRKPPKLSDFSNATAWENYARVAFGMWRDGDDVLLRVLKQTNGPMGDTFVAQFAREAAVVTGLDMRAPEARPEKPRSSRWAQREDA